MPDREEVIEALEHCMRYSYCDDCPYDGKCRDEAEALNKDILALLREMEPVEPIERNGFYYCGECHYALMTIHQKYCSNCGKKVKCDE